MKISLIYVGLRGTKAIYGFGSNMLLPLAHCDDSTVRLKHFLSFYLALFCILGSIQ